MNEHERKTLAEWCRAAILATGRITSRRQWRVDGDDMVDACVARVWRELARRGSSLWDAAPELHAIVAQCAIATANNPTLFPSYLWSQAEIASAIGVSKRSVQRWGVEL